MSTIESSENSPERISEKVKMPLYPEFDREIAFSRSVGLVTEAELAALESKTVAIAGLGGVGGHHLLTLTRMGVGGFSLAEFDQFALENFNRQGGADLSTIAQPKLDVMVDRALKINPNLRITRFA